MKFKKGICSLKKLTTSKARTYHYVCCGFVFIYFILCHFNQSTARNKDCWPGCPLDHQQDFLVVRVLGHKNMKKTKYNIYHLPSVTAFVGQRPVDLFRLLLTDFILKLLF